MDRHFAALEHHREHRQGIAGDADETALALPAQLVQSRERFTNDAPDRSVLEVVALQQVDAVDAEAAQAALEASDDALSREVEVRVAVAADLGRDRIPAARHSGERSPEHLLSAAVVRSDIEEIDALVQGEAHREHTLVLVGAPEHAPERRGAEAERGHR